MERSGNILEVELPGFADEVKVGCEKKRRLWGWGCHLLRCRPLEKEGVPVKIQSSVGVS